MPRTLIWDLDGTLIDSYDAIVNAIATAYQFYHWDFDREAIRSHILTTSVGQLAQERLEETGINFKPVYSADLVTRDHEIKILAGAQDILEWAKEQGFQQFIYTHKDKHALPLLESLGLADYFTEIVTADHGFRRKPDSQGVDYLIEKYQLNPANTYYIGDRPLDVDVAWNSGIKSINFVDYKPDFNQQIQKLSDIKALLSD